jgi:tetratricopeptide (TPR) repeat protein
MKDWKKRYDKAIHLFQNGEIDKALAICEVLISENLKNTSALNLKGLLLYIKGDLKAAESTWKINKDFNNDSISKSYLKDIEKDWSRAILYEDALKDIKGMYINEAENKLKICSESDFNKLNVNNAIAFCFIKRGQYENAKSCVDIVRGIDKDNKVALDNLKVIKEFSEEHKPKINYKLVIGIAAICVVSVVSYLSYKPVKKYVSKVTTNYLASKQQKDKSSIPISDKNNLSTNKNTTDTSKNQNAADTNKNQNATKQNNDAEQKNNTKVEEKKFPVDEVKAAVDAKDFNKLYAIITSFDKAKLGVNDVVTYNSGEDLLKNSGVQSFYDTGSKYFNAKDFAKAKVEFEKAIAFSKGNYLDQHIMYRLATTVENLGDYEKALGYYDQYINNYYGENYTDQVLYKLATINSNTDKAKAKQYAQKIQKDYSKSIYYNTTIKAILNSQ